MQQNGKIVWETEYETVNDIDGTHNWLDITFIGGATRNSSDSSRLQLGLVIRCVPCVSLGAEGGYLIIKVNAKGKWRFDKNVSNRLGVQSGKQKKK